MTEYNDLKIYCSYNKLNQYNDYNLDNVPVYIYPIYVNNLNINADNINYLNPYINELVTYYYVYKNQIYSKYIGFCHYRRFYRYIDFNNINKYNCHYYGILEYKVNIQHLNLSIAEQRSLYSYLYSLHKFDETILNDVFYNHKFINAPWKMSAIFTWDLFNEFCDILFNWISFYIKDWKNIANYINTGRYYSYKLEHMYSIILSILLNNVYMENNDYDKTVQNTYKYCLLTQSEDIDKIMLWAAKNNRTTAHLYCLTSKNIHNNVTYPEPGIFIHTIKSIKDIPINYKIINLDIDNYISCKTPEDFINNNYIIKRI